MSRVLLLGSRGRLGATLAREWSARHQVTALARADVDVTDSRALETVLARASYEILVNATGLTHVDRCESARTEAELVNARAPEIMARAAARRGARLIHFSTDYVFDGEKSSPYDELDEARPPGHYGATKHAGEKAVLATSDTHLVVRVSWIFGPDKPGFPDAIVDRAMHSPSVEAIDDKISCPTSAEDAAVWLEPFLSGLPGGLYHACNSGSCTWQEYGQEALRAAERAGVRLRTHAVRGIALADMPGFAAPRPRQTAMHNGKLAAAIGLTPRPWQDALSEYFTKKFRHAPVLPSSD